MLTVALFKAKMRNHTIAVQVDPRLIDAVRGAYPVDHLTTQDLNISINLYRLIMNIGTIQSLYFTPTNRQKFIDRMYLIEKIKDDDRLMIKIQEIRDRLGSEKLGKFSEDFGIGLALCVADHLYKINPTTIAPIKSTKKRPDIKCLTTQNEELIIESKGYSSRANLNSQRNNAIAQKMTHMADIRTVSLTLINEDCETSTEFLDPPAEPSGEDIELRKRMLMAEHYSAVFNFIGQKELSNYYRLMRNKIENQEDYMTLYEKEELFNKIKDNYVYITLNHRKYYGTVEKVDEESYSFLGVEERLLYFNGFLHFEGYEEDKTFEEKENQYFLYKDGVIVGDIHNINPFSPSIDEEKIKHYQEYTTLADIDKMDGQHFEQYIKYIFRLNDIEIVEQNQTYLGSNFDFIISKDEVKYFIEIKLVKDPKRYLWNASFNEIINNKDEDLKWIIITNAEVLPSFNNQFMIIDRDVLKKLIKKPTILSVMLENG